MNKLEPYIKFKKSSKKIAMTTDEIREYISAAAPLATFDETGEWLNILVTPTELKPLMSELRMGKMEMNYLFCLTCVDFKTHLTMVYHLSATTHRQSIVIKSNLHREQPVIETVCDIWRTAEFLEREVFEMFGVDFKNHPDLRRLILEDENPIGFDGTKGYWPLRKDFEDPINMIKL